MAKKPELGAKQRTEMAERIEKCARGLRNMVVPERDSEAEKLVNMILQDLDTLDSKRVKMEARKRQSEHVQASLAKAFKM